MNVLLHTSQISTAGLRKGLPHAAPRTRIAPETQSRSRVVRIAQSHRRKSHNRTLCLHFFPLLSSLYLGYFSHLSPSVFSFVSHLAYAHLWPSSYLSNSEF